jgi:molecular chaperone GrpE
VNRPRPDEAVVREELREESDRLGDGADPPEPAAGSPQPAEEDPRAAGRGLTSDADGSSDAGTHADAEEPSSEDDLARALRERDEYLDLAKRAQADFENYRKRASKDIAAAGARARAGLIRELLPVVDNLERALTSAPEDDPMAEGVRLVLMDMQGVLQRAGVETIEPKGETFDPNVHEALTTREEEGVESGTVLDVVEKGYKGADQVIRPARVIVAA